MDTLLTVLSVLSLVLFFVVLRSVRREHIRVEHSVSWLAAAGTILLLTQVPALFDRLAAWLHLREPATGLLFLIMIVFLGVFYRSSRVVSELKDMNITLTQRVAILEYRLKEQHEAR
jgi:hypothetical protein